MSRIKGNFVSLIIMGHKMNFKSFFYKLRHVGKVLSISLRENNTAYIRSASLQQTVRNGTVVIITWKKKLHPAQRSAQGKIVNVSVPFFQEK